MPALFIAAELKHPKFPAVVYTSRRTGIPYVVEQADGFTIVSGGPFFMLACRYKADAMRLIELSDAAA